MKTYAVKHKDEVVRACSRSGGIFTAISDDYLGNGVIYGCVLNDRFDACHIRTDCTDGRDMMRGSKYLQSHLGETLKQVKSDLAEGKRVLFSGTSCQVAGLKSFLNKEYDNLLCIDIVCHGVPSSKVWHAYLNWISSGKQIREVDFRNKKEFGWSAHVETIKLENDTIHSEVFKNLFLGHYILRPSCYECPYKSIHHPGDITIGDYWGIDQAVPGFSDNKGVSLVLINSDKGEAIFQKVKESVVWKEARIEDSMQPALIAPFPRPKNRDMFWKKFEHRDFSYIVKKYGTERKPSVYRRALDKVKRLIKRMMKME